MPKTEIFAIKKSSQGRFRDSSNEILRNFCSCLFIRKQDSFYIKKSCFRALSLSRTRAHTHTQFLLIQSSLKLRKRKDFFATFFFSVAAMQCDKAMNKFLLVGLRPKSHKPKQCMQQDVEATYKHQQQPCVCVSVYICTVNPNYMTC